MDEKLDKITSSIIDELSCFKKELRCLIEKTDNFLKDDLIDFVFEGAKFLRPRLVFLFSKILKIKDENVLKIALVVELLHNASLIHDDILDDEKTRRNSKTFNFKYNSKVAVLEGDLLLALALNVLSKTNGKIIEIFSDKMYKTIKGELKQNENSEKVVDVETYLNKTFNKTANLFMAGLESLIILKETPENLKENLKNFLINFCFAFQIQNDIKDIESEKFSDYKNGNYTLPMLYFFMDKTDNPLNCNLDEYIQKAKQTVKSYKTKALECLKILNEDDSEIKILKELVEYI